MLMTVATVKHLVASQLVVIEVRIRRRVYRREELFSSR